MRLKELRLNAKLTQEQIAKILNITQATYSNYEKGITEPDIKLIKKIASYYNVTTDYILECNNQFDIGFLDQETKELVKQIKLLNKEQKDRLSGYLEAMLQDSNKYNKEFNNFKDNF